MTLEGSGVKTNLPGNYLDSSCMILRKNHFSKETDKRALLKQYVFDDQTQDLKDFGSS
jgi:hypothetical protein